MRAEERGPWRARRARSCASAASGGHDVSSDLIAQIEQARFTPVRGREGYDMGEVDQLLDELVAALAAGQPVAPVVDGVRFATTRWREGYDMADVDALRAQVRAGDASASSPPPSPVTPVPSGVVEEQQGLLSRLLGRRPG